MIDYELQGPRSEERSRIRLVSALREGRFPQSVLIDGPAGVGKKKLAMGIVQALMCTHPEHRPCGACFGCKMAMNPEVVDNWLLPLAAKEASAKAASEATSKTTAKTVEDYTQEYVAKVFENPYAIDYLPPGATISVELVRSLTKRFALKSSGVRCVIVAEAERMNISAANAFLKTLEEVPPNTYFILTTTSRDLLLETIRSRCLSLHLQPWTDAEVRAELDKREIEVNDDVLGLSLGSPGRAMFFNEYAAKFTELSAVFICDSLAGEFSKILRLVEEEVSNKTLGDVNGATLFLDVLSFLLTDILRKQAGLDVRLPETIGKLSERALELSPVALHEALKNVQETSKIIAGRSVNVLVALQALAIKLFDGYR